MEGTCRRIIKGEEVGRMVEKEREMIWCYTIMED